MKEKTPYNLEIGKVIRAEREKKGWSQAHLAEQADISHNFIARIERSELGTSLLVADKICQALGMSIDKLVSGAPELL